MSAPSTDSFASCVGTRSSTSSSSEAALRARVRRSMPPPGACARRSSRAKTLGAAPRRGPKLVHGGVRYLEKAVFQLSYGQLKLVFEALQAKNLLRNAPHLARPLPIATPCYHGWEVPYYWAGMKAYDLVAGTSGLTLSASEPPPSPSPSSPRSPPCARRTRVP